MITDQIGLHSILIQLIAITYLMFYTLDRQGHWTSTRKLVRIHQEPSWQPSRNPQISISEATVLVAGKCASISVAFSKRKFFALPLSPLQGLPMGNSNYQPTAKALRNRPLLRREALLEFFSDTGSFVSVCILFFIAHLFFLWGFPPPCSVLSLSNKH